MSISLPTFIESESAIAAKKDTALHRFIHEFEPSTIEDERTFRDMLSELVHEQRAAGASEIDKEAADLLRSACCIAERQGEGTAWHRFIASVRKLGLNGITARTYRILPSDGEQEAPKP